jgi:hypothetical protein
MKKLLLVLAAAILFSCNSGGKHPIPVVPESTTGDYNVVFLFELEDVSVYRFYDSGHYRYLAVGQNAHNIWTTQTKIRTVGRTTITETWDDGVLCVQE